MKCCHLPKSEHTSSEAPRRGACGADEADTQRGGRAYPPRPPRHRDRSEYFRTARNDRRRQRYATDATYRKQRLRENAAHADRKRNALWTRSAKREARRRTTTDWSRWSILNRDQLRNPHFKVKHAGRITHERLSQITPEAITPAWIKREEARLLHR